MISEMFHNMLSLSDQLLDSGRATDMNYMI